jgi:hypothetical protein
MKPSTHPSLIASLAGALILSVGCGSELEGGDCARCDVAPDGGADLGPTSCDEVVVDQSGNNIPNVLRTLNDPFVNHVYKVGDTCPTTFAAIMEKLEQTDTAGCEGGSANVRTRIVSETAQPRGEAQTLGSDGSYRAVVTRTCDGRREFELTLAVFGLQVGGALPEAVEIMAFDPDQGVFNYYKTAGDRMEFFGSSLDMLKGPGADGHTRECAACHTGGGFVMKELAAPWMHWEDRMDVPGAADLVSAHAAHFGQKTGGINMERITEVGNDAWNETRVRHLWDHGSVAELLEPLFCTVEVNLNNPTGFPGEELRNMPATALVDSFLRDRGEGVAIASADYEAAIAATGQHVPGLAGHVDTVFPLAHIERAGADINYVGVLLDAGISEAFVEAVLAVDFTRPIFSDDRCGLLSFAPELALAERSAASIRDGFLANLEAAPPSAGSPAAEFLANLRGDFDPNAAIDAFLASCEALTGQRVDFRGVETSAWMANLIQVVSLNRAKARALPVFEFPQTMPADELSVPAGTRLHPKSCELTTEFVPVSSGG